MLHEAAGHAQTCGAHAIRDHEDDDSALGGREGRNSNDHQPEHDDQGPRKGKEEGQQAAAGHEPTEPVRIVDGGGGGDEGRCFVA